MSTGPVSSDEPEDQLEDQPASVARGHGHVFLLIQVAAGLFALVLLVWRVDLAAAFRLVPNINIWWALAGVFVFTGSKAIHAYRWRHFLRHRPELTFRFLLPLFLVSNLANALVPFRAGDLIRIELPSRQFHVPRAELASSVVLVESLLDALAFVLLLLSGLLLLDLPPVLRPTLAATGGGVVALMLVSVGAARGGRSWDIERWPPLRWLPERVSTAIAGLVDQFIDGMAALRDPGDALVALALSVAAWTAEIAVYWLMGQAFGVDFSVAQALVVMVAANLIVSIPITPWSVGPYEVVVTEALVLMGTDRALASSYAVGSHLLLLAWIGLTGAIAMWALDLRPRQLLGSR